MVVVHSSHEEKIIDCEQDGNKAYLNLIRFSMWHMNELVLFFLKLWFKQY